MHRLLVVLAALLALAGCTADRAPATPSSATSIPAPAQRCHGSGNGPITAVVLTTADHVRLAGVRFGSGPRGVLLLPQRGADLCGWWDYGNDLARQGFHALAIDVRGTGFSEPGPTGDLTADAVAGIAALKQAGAQRVVLLGASVGAATALVTAGRVPDQVAGVVALSYPDDGLDVTGGTGGAPHTPAQAAPLITAPLLACYTTGDRQAAKPDALIAAARGPAKQLVGRPGVSHGWDMLKVGTDDVRPDVLAFLQSYA